MATAIWEHTIRDDADYAAYVDYVHINPFKHGFVQHVRDCPYSTFYRLVKREFIRMTDRVKQRKWRLEKE